MNIRPITRCCSCKAARRASSPWVPLNLFGIAPKADFVHTGTWSKKAIGEAKRYGTARTVASSEDKEFQLYPKLDKSMFDPTAAYAHITTNNTIEGTRFRELPDTGSVPLVGRHVFQYFKRVSTT